MADLRVDGSPRVTGAMRAAVGARLDEEVGHLTKAARVARGKAARKAVPRESQAVFDSSAGRRDPVGLLEEQAPARLPELVPIRYGRMLVSPFTYFRGAALPMASDLATTPSSGLVVQACGDAHLSNFGIFATPERRFLFSVNDFDETLPGPWEWDIKRLAASIEVAARKNGFTRAQRRQIVTAAGRRYREAMRTFATMRNLDLWYIRADLDLVQKEFLPQMTMLSRKRVAQALAKAHTRDSMLAFSKLCGEIDGQVRIIADPPLIMPASHLLHAEEDRAGFEAQVEELSRSTAEASKAIDGSCSSGIGSPTWPAKWSVSAAWERGAGSFCFRTRKGLIHCSCNSRRPSRQCWPPLPVPARTRTKVSGS